MFEAFAGYGSQALAMERLSRDYPGFSCKTVGISEIDPYAVKAYTALHGDCPNFGDISKINWEEVPDFDLFTYSFPCQDISSAGLQRGFTEKSGTRSALLWECRRAIEVKRPRFLLMENVKALLSDKFRPTLKCWEQWLASLGYNNFTAVLDAADYGVPQHRERVFMVSILGNFNYYFPVSFPLKRRLGDITETTADESFFISEKMLESFKRISEDGSTGFKFETKSEDDIASTILAGSGRTCDNYIQIKQLGNIVNDSTYKIQDRIRRLTPREYFRLMDVDDCVIDKIQAAGLSKTRQYKLAGNSIVVACLYHIFRTLFLERENPSPQLTIFDVLQSFHK